ncbi:hypothetical protein BGZ63DRAFT_359442 [Mariannaea sp. PMI_226]|nr:hypothetical protein BGZ63DRAFT_359442 [Mariannaea sp. PMI_226]
MNQAIVHTTTRVEIQPSDLTTLFDALCNSLVLRNTLPYLPVSGLVNLASTCRDFRYLIYQTPGVFRHLDLTHVKTAQPETGKEIDNDLVWHNVNLLDYLTEDDFYSGPLRGVFSTLRQRDLLRDVQSLILDGLSVTAEMCHEIINDPSYNVRLLSIRDVKHMNQGKLRSALTYACRSSRPEGMPKLKALYFFGSKDADWNQKSQKALTSSIQGQEADAWWFRKGRMVSNPIEGDWANCLLACNGLIAFDAVLCQGPRHQNSPLGGTCSAAIATFAVGGCASCGESPEGLMDARTTPHSCLPLLSPPPILSSSVQAATTPAQGWKAFAPRCADCLRERYCVCCNKWWCEACYQAPAPGGPRISRSCWECGSNCDECIERTQKYCKKCCGGYCLIHNEGSSDNFVRCVSRGRGLTRL